jgi:hypothetical protein
MAFNEIAAQIANFSRLRALFGNAAHVLLLDLDLNGPGEEGAIRIALSLNWGRSKSHNNDKERKRRNERFDAMIAQTRSLDFHLLSLPLTVLCDRAHANHQHG